MEDSMREVPPQRAIIIYFYYYYLHLSSSPPERPRFCCRLSAVSVPFLIRAFTACFFSSSSSSKSAFQSLSMDRFELLPLLSFMLLLFSLHTPKDNISLEKIRSLAHPVLICLSVPLTGHKLKGQRMSAICLPSFVKFIFHFFPLVSLADHSKYTLSPFSPNLYRYLKPSSSESSIQFNRGVQVAGQGSAGQDRAVEEWLRSQGKGWFVAWLVLPSGGGER